MAASFSKLPASGRLPGSAQHGPPPLPSPAAPRYLALCAHMIEPLVAAELRALPEVTDV